MSEQSSEQFGIQPVVKRAEQAAEANQVEAAESEAAEQDPQEDPEAIDDIKAISNAKRQFRIAFDEFVMHGSLDAVADATWFLKDILRLKPSLVAAAQGPWSSKLPTGVGLRPTTGFELPEMEFPDAAEYQGLYTTKLALGIPVPPRIKIPSRHSLEFEELPRPEKRRKRIH